VQTWLQKKEEQEKKKKRKKEKEKRRKKKKKYRPKEFTNSLSSFFKAKNRIN
jgi:hypothetical protein